MNRTEKIIVGATHWIDVTDPTPADMENLSAEFRLNQHTVRDCLQPEHLPKYEYDQDVDVHFLILRFIASDVSANASTIQELTDKIAIFFTEEVLITIHKDDVPFLQTLVDKYKAGGKEVSSTALLSRIVWLALETYDDPAGKISDQVDAFESQVLLKTISTDITESLYYIKRQASVSFKVLTLMLEPINHIAVKPGEESLLQDVRDQHLKMQTLYGQIIDQVNNLLNLSMSFAAQRTNDVMRVLTLFSVFFMPLTFIVGIYGMNFEWMPELRQKWGYPAVLTLMAAIALAIVVWFKRKRWI